jgi:hypothetical protein
MLRQLRQAHSIRTTLIQKLAPIIDNCNNNCGQLHQQPTTPMAFAAIANDCVLGHSQSEVHKCQTFIQKLVLIVVVLLLVIAIV